MEKEIARVVLTRQYHHWLAQAKRRGETVEINKQQYLDLWLADDRWHHVGRVDKDRIQMCRVDRHEGWYLDNIVFRTRSEHMRTVNEEK